MLFVSVRPLSFVPSPGMTEIRERERGDDWKMDRRLVRERKTREKQPFRGSLQQKTKWREGDRDRERERNHEKTRERATSARRCGIHAGFVLVYGTVSCQWQDGVAADCRVADCRCLYWSPEKAVLPLSPSISEVPHLLQCTGSWHCEPLNVPSESKCKKNPCSLSGSSFNEKPQEFFPGCFPFEACPEPFRKTWEATLWNSTARLWGGN